VCINYMFIVIAWWRDVVVMTSVTESHDVIAMTAPCHSSHYIDILSVCRRLLSLTHAVIFCNRVSDVWNALEASPADSRTLQTFKLFLKPADIVTHF